MDRTLDEARHSKVAPWDELILDLGSVKIFADRYPVTPGHRLFVPRNNTQDNIMECFEQAYKYGRALQDNGGCDGFNVGMNVGASAGQTVMYPHVHCIPRRRGDCADPTGGVRGVIPGQANYKQQGYRNPDGV